MRKSGADIPKAWLSSRGIKDLVVGIFLIVLPPLVLEFLGLGIGRSVYLVCLMTGAILIIRTWSRE